VSHSTLSQFVFHSSVVKTKSECSLGLPPFNSVQDGGHVFSI